MTKKEKQAKQQLSDVKSIWSTIDKYMFIHPKASVNEELIEERSFLPPNQLLINNKDKEPDEPEALIQAATKKLKLINFTKFIKFLTQKRSFNGLDMNNIPQIISACDNRKVNLSDLCKEREQTMKTFKSPILIRSNYS